MTKVPYEFRCELESLINKHSVENVCNTPDYMLAEHICAEIERLGQTIRSRDIWFNLTPFENGINDD